MKKLYVVGIGPGDERNMTAACRNVLRQADVIVGYSKYVELVAPLHPGKRTLDTPMTRETERCRTALNLAVQGQTVVVVCSGDAGVYGMAGLIYELSGQYPPVEIEIIPGVTAALAGAAVLGAPLTHDFAVISLSDLLTPWELIEKRLVCAATADFCLALYNPASKKRQDYLQKACAILLEFKSPGTVCGLVRNIGREGERAEIMTLEQLGQAPIDMFTTVFVGNAQTKKLNGKMVTPRGYRLD
ncbi:MAG: precorrin-3B C(17)-methyltransferase [Clostridia bacterium]|jgi:precorrin-3B C17-methyltransferase|nr:precorrin-3B C(17)-methyltransferase [Clostridia bacterium]